MTNFAILGSGMAGMGAAHQLHCEGQPSVLYEKTPYYGGHTTSFYYEGGFTFDDGPHISFTSIERIQKLFAESVHGEFEQIKAYVNNYWKGHWVKHPVQCNMHGLPTDMVVKILSEMVEAQKNHRPEGRFKNYEEWLYAAYGKTFSQTFPMVYGLKYHTTTAGNMSTDWLGPRLYQPKLEEVFYGALSPTTPDVHYITHFRYPRKGGFVSFLSMFLKQTEVKLNHRLVGLNPKKKELRFENGAAASYDQVISSIPLPVLVPMIDGVPADVREASQRLSCSTCVVVNVAINRRDIIDAHWTYFYDPDIFFTRLSTPHMQSGNNCPPGVGSMQAEVYFSPKHKPMNCKPEDCIEPVIRDLRRVGLIREEDKIVFKNALYIPYANVIFDLERAGALAKVHGYLDDIGVHYCGRYGDWGYMWTDQSFISGEKAAERALEAVTARTAAGR